MNRQKETQTDKKNKQIIELLDNIFHGKMKNIVIDHSVPSFLSVTVAKLLLQAAVFLFSPLFAAIASSPSSSLSVYSELITA